MIEKLKEEHFDEVVELLIKKFNESYNFYPVLPKKELTQDLLKKVEWIFRNQSGYVKKGKHIESFILNIFVDDLFYNKKGVYTPEWGHYLRGKEDLDLLTMTYEDMLKGGYVQHSISIMNDKSDLQKFFFDNSYGSRCMDANTIPIKTIYKPTYKIRRMIDEDFEQVVKLLSAHQQDMNRSPSLLGFDTKEYDDLLERWYNNESTAIFVVEDQNIVGMMKTVRGISGGCFIASNKDTLGIETTQLDPEYRGKGIAKELLQHVLNYAVDEGFKYVAVDYETCNPSAHYFWPKFFTPTIRSFIRHIN